VIDHSAHALELAQRLGAVHPLHPRSKRPVFDGWQKIATQDPNLIAAWWGDEPDRNIALLPEGRLVALDVDPRDGGGELLARLEARHGVLPATLTCLTGGVDGGEHRYFLAAEPVLRVGNLGRGLELRGARSRYVVAPPSIHPDSGRRYAWADPEVEPAPLPAWVLPLVSRPDRSSTALGVIPASVDVTDRRLLELLDHARGPIHDLSSQDYAIACEASRLGYADDQIAALIVDHRQRHGDPKAKAARVDYLERTVGAARAATRGQVVAA
jgi:hypothetical protein